MKSRGIVLIFVIMTNMVGCKEGHKDILLECSIEYVFDNMPYDDDEYVDSFPLYPRRVNLGCTIENTSDRIVSIPFKTFANDTTPSSYFRVIINDSDEFLPSMVSRMGRYDNYRIRPKEKISMEMKFYIRQYRDGKLAKEPLRDLLSQMRLEYVKDSADNHLSDNEMANIIVKKKNVLYLNIEKKEIELQNARHGDELCMQAEHI